ncbi:MAG: MBL fold metallo-hydrolase [Candidatus Omnitrophota bacterium]|jgi:ribonuclease BN (tRNA processing enzyme)|nr:MAG: MBL fold metallo-hydrolase [Candidatus Omnitrophota bacterium]
MAEWRVYGCGSASSNRSLQSSYEFVHGACRMQIDFGNGAIYQRCRVEGHIHRVLDAITHLYLTHSHPDHCVDLTRHAVAWKYTPNYSPGPPVHLYGTETTLQSVKTMLDHVGLNGYYEEIYIPHVVTTGISFEIDAIKFTPIRSHHIDGSAGIRMETSTGLKIAFTGDTGLYEGQTEELSNLDLLVMEASFSETELFMHLTLDEASKLAAVVNPKELMLVHFYPEIEVKSNEEIKRIIVANYKGPIHLAHDGLALKWDENGWQSYPLFQNGRSVLHRKHESIK